MANLIDKLVMVGGVSKIPYVRKKLEEIFQKHRLISETVIDPITAVAVGGAYPREPQHYSISVPPYGFYLDGENIETGQLIRYEVFEPFEYYSFHDAWAVNAQPAHSKFLYIGVDLSKVKLSFQKAGDKEMRIIQKIGFMKSCRWKFFITLEGVIAMQKIGGRVQVLSRYPTIHPIQQAITDAMNERARKERLEAEKKMGDYDDWIRDWRA